MTPGQDTAPDHQPQIFGLSGALDLAVIVPTFNEIDNIEPMISALIDVLTPLNFEIIFVDDNSPDGTADRVRALAGRYPQVRCLQRVGRRGLSSAVIEGFLATSAPYAVVIDGDFQHDETRLPQMLEYLIGQGLDLVVGTRYGQGGGTGNWSEQRRKMSERATGIAKRLTGVTLSDPMSGFFMMRTDQFRVRVADLTGVGYKILLDILSARGPKLSIAEIPYQFRNRQAGESKLDNKVILEFVELLIARTVGRILPTKFIMFSMVGALGVLVHLAVLSSLFGSGALSFVTAQAMATLVAMTANFFVNNFFTYFDRQLKGWGLLSGWLSFSAASAVGALANIGLSAYLFENLGVAWLGAALVGIIVGATWNYAITALFTWRPTA
ncbi:MAG: glycosyltransferase family 2 protein [Paracoccaceae bacterium]